MVVWRTKTCGFGVRGLGVHMGLQGRTGGRQEVEVAVGLVCRVFVEREEEFVDWRGSVSLRSFGGHEEGLKC